MRRVTLMFCRFKGGPGDRIMNRPPKFTHSRDPFRQDPQPPHRFFPQPPPTKTGADAEFMEYQVEQFEVGKRHLANMMGVEEDALSQRDIDQCIRYLFPSALFEKSARPVMKNPLDLFPVASVLDVDENRRPKDPFFYSVSGKFSRVCFILADAIHEGDESLRKGRRPQSRLPYDPTIQRWKDKKAIENILKLKLSEELMRHFNTLIRRLACHPMAAEYGHLLDMFRVKYDGGNTSSSSSSVASTHRTTVNDVEGCLEGNPHEPYSIALGAKHTARARVELRPCAEKERSEVRVNNVLLSEHFDYIQDREQVLFPLSVTKMYDSFHITATVQGGGRSSQSNAVRLALARAMVPFLHESLVEKLRLAGLLTRDPRRRERNKIAQHGARRKKQFRKR